MLRQVSALYLRIDSFGLIKMHYGAFIKEVRKTSSNYSVLPINTFRTLLNS